VPNSAPDDNLKADPPVPSELVRLYLRHELCAYLDSLTITGENIGDIRRSCFVPWDSAWNGIVRDETAEREVKTAADPPVGDVPLSVGKEKVRLIELSILVGRWAKLSGHPDPDGISWEEAAQAIESRLKAVGDVERRASERLLELSERLRFANAIAEPDDLRDRVEEIAAELAALGDVEPVIPPLLKHEEEKT
jgi:hypothetical protein